MLEYKGYVGVVQFDPSVGMMHGSVVNTRDVITFEADNVGDLEKEFHASVDDYLDWCKKDGVEPERPYSGTLNVRLGSELHKKLAVYAAHRGKSLNAYIKEQLEGIEEYV